METMLKVKGMHCTGCERTITNALLKLKGVKSVKVSYVNEMASVEHNDKLSSFAIIKAIEEAGYEASIVPSASPRKKLFGLF